MQPNKKQEIQTHPAPKNKMGDFFKALSWTLIPFLIFTIWGTVSTRISSQDVSASELWAIFYWPIGIVLSMGAIIAGIVFGRRGKGRIEAGIFTGMGIGIVFLSVSCFTLPGMF